MPLIQIKYQTKSKFPQSLHTEGAPLAMTLPGEARTG